MTKAIIDMMTETISNNVHIERTYFIKVLTTFLSLSRRAPTAYMA